MKQKFSVAVTQDEITNSYTKFDVELPSKNSAKQPQAGASFQTWYKGSTNSEDGILSYTLPGGPLELADDSDVKHTFNISTAGLIISNLDLNDAGTYYYVESSHTFSVLLNVTGNNFFFLFQAINF